ncbi:MAG: flagellar assembly peptidoglycan hydrolase FlgJ [Gammaproteobacteria bacterium]|nr:flagellar assembly peptidoglycan hydrolase FlgJ [Gammaproteobacteria bacterium]
MSDGIASLLSTASDTARLRLQAGNGEQEVNDEIFQQFEALFLQQMLKSMRTASLSEGMFQSEQSEFYRDMYDQQIATDLAKKEVLGIANILNRQLGGSSENAVNDEQNAQEISFNEVIVNRVNTDISNDESEYVEPIKSGVDDFVEKLAANLKEDSVVDANIYSTNEIKQIRPLAFKPETPNEFVELAYKYAQAPAERLGVDAKVLVAIAALETGWGNHVPKDVRGSSNNYFGIKADTRWDGDHVGSKTLEFENGAFNELKQSFRAYDSLKESFEDYAEFLLGNDRYSYALEFASDAKKFLSEIQNAGYATDPNYANKILNVLDNAAFSKLRQ